MKRLFSITTIIFFLIPISYVFSHVEHYKNLKFLKYGLYFNDKLIGHHSFEFNKKGDLINKSLWLATLLFIINHMFDVTYYDIRLSMIFWILLASLESIIKEDQLTNNLEIKSN